MARFIPSVAKPWVENYAILLRPSDDSAESAKARMIGTVGATRVASVSSDEDAIEIAYGLHSDYWGKGYMPEALGMFIKLYWAEHSTTTAFPLLSSVIYFSLKAGRSRLTF